MKIDHKDDKDDTCQCQLLERMEDVEKAEDCTERANKLINATCFNFNWYYLYCEIRACESVEANVYKPTSDGEDIHIYVPKAYNGKSIKP